MIRTKKESSFKNAQFSHILLDRSNGIVVSLTNVIGLEVIKDFE